MTKLDQYIDGKGNLYNLLYIANESVSAYENMYVLVMNKTGNVFSLSEAVVVDKFSKVGE